MQIQFLGFKGNLKAIFLILWCCIIFSCTTSKIQSARSQAFNSQEFIELKEQYLAWKTNMEARHLKELKALNEKEYKKHASLKLDNRFKTISEGKELKSYSTRFFERYPLKTLKLSPEEFMEILEKDSV